MQNSRVQSFRLLGVSPDSSVDEIKRAYRRIAKRLHPDRRGGDLNAFRRITAAYNQLLEDHKGGKPRAKQVRPAKSAPTVSPSRAASGRTQQPGNAHGSSSNTHSKTVGFTDFRFEWSSEFEHAERARRAKKESTRKTTAQGPSTVRKSDDVESLEGVEAWKVWRSHVNANNQIKDPVESTESSVTTATAAQEGAVVDLTEASILSKRIFGWFKKQKRHFQVTKPVHKGENVTLRLRTTDQTLLFGGHHRIAIQRLAVCPSCQGASERSCSICRNAGRVKVREEVTVYVPPGALSGTQIKVPGKGTAGLFQKGDGDLILIVEHEPPRGFRVDDLDLIGTFRLDKTIARRGGVVAVDVPRGKVKVRIPAQTVDGDRLRLKGQGIPSLTSNLVGDVYLDLSIGRIS
jgi:DnaJ-class molecular chaperone